MKVGALHTVPALAPVFDDLLHTARDDLDVVHIADASLLARTVAAGQVTDPVRTDIGAHLGALTAAGAEAVLVTCSSIGEASERAALEGGVRLVRVDEAMAHEAVRRARRAGGEASRAGRIAVLATLRATLEPTTRLVERARADADIAIVAAVVAGAAHARSVGDDMRHDRLIAGAIADTDADVIVLAQASMAAAGRDAPRTLTSPASGARAFLDALEDAS